jgi:MSHA pilin protein MshD
MPNKLKQLSSAFTLIEILVTIVVISIAGTALMSVYSSMVARSADPIIQQQALAIAEAYIEEIRLKAFSDPDGIEGETRPNYDDIQDYNGLPDNIVRDQNGVAVSSLSAYTVTVNVVGQKLAGVAATDSMRIDVVVNHPAIDPITLSSFRTSYF